MFERYYTDPMIREIQALIFKMVGRFADAATLTQETFTKFYVVLHGGKEVKNPPAFLATVAANLARDHLRRHSTRREDLVEEFPDRTEWTTAAQTVGSDAMLDVMELVTAMNKVLSPEPRLCLVLNRWGGLSRQEIAEILGIKPESVTKNVSRAIAQLENHLETKQPGHSISLEGGTP
ncbi:MAG: sigma-70 family RNA polymerase sigma factor [Catenulispora sp.]|nr:sigma-70 family RNA polymerase sigma factor [Catenulispora sp.]